VEADGERRNDPCGRHTHPDEQSDDDAESDADPGHDRDDAWTNPTTREDGAFGPGRIWVTLISRGP